MSWLCASLPHRHFASICICMRYYKVETPRFQVFLTLLSLLPDTNTVDCSVLYLASVDHM